MRIGVVIPAYNVGSSLDAVLSKVLNHVHKKFVFVVDDGSSDSTYDVAEKSGVNFLRHEKNMGKGAALRDGFHLALCSGIEAVFTIDGDGQHDPDCIPDFINLMREEASDIVLGVRPLKINNMSLDRIVSNRLSSLIISMITGKWFRDSQCGFRLIRSMVLQRMLLTSSHYEMETELLIKAAWMGFKISFCPIKQIRNRGGSSIMRYRDTIRFCKLILNLIKERLFNRDIIELISSQRPE